MQRKFVMTFHTPGTGVDQDIKFTVPSNCELRHVSAVSSAAQNGTFTLGTSAAATGFLTASAIGDSGVPNEFELADFDGTLLAEAGKDYPRLSDGDIMAIAVDTDGGVSGTADDLTIVLTFAEG